MKIIALTLIALSINPLFARSPAVDPVTGISIEEYRETNPKTGKGYDFTNDESVYTEAHNDAELNATTAFFLIVASALPFVVWFGVMRALPDATPTESQSAPKPTFSVINGEGKKSDEDEHDSLPKAS